MFFFLLIYETCFSEGMCFKGKFLVWKRQRGVLIPIFLACDTCSDWYTSHFWEIHDLYFFSKSLFIRMQGKKSKHKTLENFLQDKKVIPSRLIWLFHNIPWRSLSEIIFHGAFFSPYFWQHRTFTLCGVWWVMIFNEHLSTGCCRDGSSVQKPEANASHEVVRVRKTRCLISRDVIQIPAKSSVLKCQIYMCIITFYPFWTLSIWF